MRISTHIPRFFFFSFLGVIGLILTFYILLASGGLGGFPDTLATKLSSVDITTVEFHGLRTNLFRKTWADSVIVSDTKGLRITITQPDISGNLLDFALNRHLNRLSVERLMIDVPPPSGSSKPPPTLTEILEDIDLGIVTSADSLILVYGAVSDTSGILVDSMYLRTSVMRDAGVLLGISDIGVFIPGFGKVNGHGSLGLEDNVVSTTGFSASAAPGSLTIIGSLTGEGAVPDIDFSGTVSTAFLDWPVSVDTDLEGRIFGTLGNPELSLSFSGGSAYAFGNPVTVSVDSVHLGLDSILIDSLRMENEEFNLSCNGCYNFESSEWDASLVINASELDVNKWYPDIPHTAVTGIISIAAEGSEQLNPTGSVGIDLQSSTVAGRSIEFLQAEAHLDSGKVECSGSIDALDARMNFIVSSGVSSNFELSGMSATITGSLYSTRILRLFGVSGIPAFSRADVRLNAEGELSNIALNGSVELDAINLGNSMVDHAKLSGSCEVAGSSIRADCSILVDSLHISSTTYQISADASVRNDRITVENITAENSIDRMIIGNAMVDLGSVSTFYLSDITATRSKLRLITQGGASGSVRGPCIEIDTLWIAPPVGFLGLSGSIDSEKGIDIDATLHQFDFSTLALLLAFPVNLSGVGDFELSIQESGNGINGHIRGTIDNPEYDYFTMDSLMMDITVGLDSIVINDVSCWRDSIRSEFRGKASGYWTDGRFAFNERNIDYFYVDVANIGDWLFYILPVPFRTLNANVTAKAEYTRADGSFASGLTIDASANIEYLFITALGASFPDVNLSLQYPVTTDPEYNTKLSMNAGDGQSGSFSLDSRLNIESFIPFSLGEYSFNTEISNFELPIMGMGILVASGSLSSAGDAFDKRPLLSGDITIDRSILGIPEISESSTGPGGSEELPFDLSINISCPGDVWIRSSYANIEVAVNLDILTLDEKPTINGTVSCVRGEITLYQRELNIITDGTDAKVTFVQGDPVQIELDITAECYVTSIMSRDEYRIVVTVSGDASHPVITFGGSGPDGTLSTEDAMTLLSIGLTYGELQQVNSQAFRTGVEGAAQSLLGSYLARNLRGLLRLDTFEITPELLTDSTSLIVDAGKYVLPNLFLSYKIDVFSSDPGTVSAQYMILRNLFVEGNTLTTIQGEAEPTIELHYIYRY